jgi:hypothetical protein
MKGRKRSIAASGGKTAGKRRFPFNNNGTAMAEAAVILPLVIAGVMAVIYIVISLYLSLSLQTSLHLALRRECGELSQTVYRPETAQDIRRDFQPERGFSGIRPTVRMEKERGYQIKSIFADRITRKEEGRAYLIDEAELARILSFAGEGTVNGAD